MNPSIWGPKMWFTLHTITLNYPTKPTHRDQQSYYNFFTTLQSVLPCDDCATHYRTYLEKNPITNHLKTRKDLVLWLINIHNEVNKKLGKPVMNARDALLKMNKQYKKKFHWNYLYFTLGGIIVVGFILYLYQKRRHKISAFAKAKFYLNRY
tara:strand:+ start:363 stop:818 length:456 start_codon:yes stop_codon:yes gene_type:complete